QTYGVCTDDVVNSSTDVLLLTSLAKNLLYPNNGDGTFTAATEKTGLQQKAARYRSGCTFVDYDRDGHLDLFVSHYIDMDLASTPVAGSNRPCKYKGVPVNCGPLGLKKEFCTLYHNNGDGTFTEVTE